MECTGETRSVTCSLATGLAQNVADVARHVNLRIIENYLRLRSVTAIGGLAKSSGDPKTLRLMAGGRAGCSGYMTLVLDVGSQVARSCAINP